MAISPKTEYSGQVDTTDSVGYPEGKARNITDPGDGTGTPWEAKMVNDIFGFQQSLLSAAGEVPSGTPDKVGASQYFDALESRITTRTDPLTSILRPDLTDRGAFAHAEDATPAWDSVASRPHWSPGSSAASAFDIMEAYSSTGVLSWKWMPGRNLPFRCTITTIRVWVKPAVARAVGARMTLRYTKIVDLAPVVSAPVEDDGATGWQKMEFAGLSIPLIATNTTFFPPGATLGLLVTLRAGVGGTLPIADQAMFCEVRWTDSIL